MLSLDNFMNVERVRFLGGLLSHHCHEVFEQVAQKTVCKTRGLMCLDRKPPPWTVTDHNLNAAWRTPRRIRLSVVNGACLTPGAIIPPMCGRFLPGFLLIAVLSLAQQKPDFTGDYVGSLGPMHVKLHLIAGRDGTLTGTVDSPDQNLLGLPCADFHINGQALSFTVPMVRGAWSGFISGDGASLSGMWNQGSPMPLNLTRSVAANTADSTTTSAISPRTGAAEVKWDDYIFRFNQAGTMAQVFEGGKVVGTILTMNGEQQVIPVPGPDSDKLKKSFEDYKAFNARSHSGNSSAAVTTTAPSPGQQPASPPEATSFSMPVNGSGATASVVRFDEATHTITVPRPDGVTVTFVGEDVKIAGFHKANYIVRHQKGSVGRFLESNVDHSTRAGGSLSGGGEEFLREGGGIIYDSGMGGVNLQESHQVLLAKQLSQVAVDAVADVRRMPGHENFAPPGYNSLKEISQYRLRSDGSR